MAEEITRFYKDLDWCAIIHKKASFLERPLEEEEIKKIIWSTDKDKGPDLDGFSAEFFQVCWHIIKADLLKMLEEFHKNRKIGVNFIFYLFGSKER